jgi:hypothetical protein
MDGLERSSFLGELSREIFLSQNEAFSSLIKGRGGRTPGAARRPLAGERIDLATGDGFG